MGRQSRPVPLLPGSVRREEKQAGIMSENWIDLAVRRRACFGEDGQDMVEYALLLGMISIAAIAIVILVGPQISDTFQYIVNGLGQA